MKHSILFVTFLFLWLNSSAQKHDNIWTVGSAYPVSSQLDFTFAPPDTTLYYTGEYPQDTQISYSDFNGNYHFGTNGVYLLNKLGQAMDGSYGLNFIDPVLQTLGASCQMEQSALVIPHPNGLNQCVLFHIPCPYSNGSDNYGLQLAYSIIDLDANNGLGKVISKNNLGLFQYVEFGSLQATKHANGIDWWIIIHGLNNANYYTLLFTANGIEAIKPQTLGGSFSDRTSYGQSSFSPDGNWFCLNRSPEYYTELFRFDRCTGLLSSPQRIYERSQPSASFSPLGCAFSSNSQYLYISTSDTIFQYDVLQYNIPSSIYVVGTHDSYYYPLQHGFHRMQLAPDSKIYIDNISYGHKLHVINNPDQNGVACNFQQHGQTLASLNNYPNLPIYPHYRTQAYTCSPLAVNDHSTNPSLLISPNPCVSSLRIQGDYHQLKNFKLHLMDAFGRKYTVPYQNKSNEIQADVSMLNSGVYSAILEGVRQRIYFRVAVSR